MSRHITDHPREGEGRVVNFTRIERNDVRVAPHPATTHLQRRATEIPAHDPRTAEFLRVARGESA